MGLLLKMKKHKMFIMLFCDIVMILLSHIVAQYIMNQYFDMNTLIMTLRAAIIGVVIYEIVLIVFDVYRNIIKYENGYDYLVYIFACFCSFLLQSSIMQIFGITYMTVKALILVAILASLFLVSYRICIRFILSRNWNLKPKSKKNNNLKNLLIIGAGVPARDIIKIIKNRLENEYNIVGIIDDNVDKLGYSISGVRIIGNRTKIEEICKKYDVNTIFFTIYNVSPDDKKEILELCQNTGAKIKILPSTEQLIKGKNVIENLRDIKLEDVLCRDPIILDNRNISSLIKDKVILVTGGGGSIGSELCRQIANYEPKKLIILDIYENSLYDIELELKSDYKNIEIIPVIASIRDKKSLELVFEKYRPYLVFHAAAHKHVPLMEGSPLEAIKNNVFGTHNLIEVSDKYNVKKYIQISTDKAVNPTNIMGATKRICEMMVQAKDKVSKTEYAAVRFGNVLGSNGSVVPLFKKQIAKGGPVTVTHKEITRFFMTIPEAVSLVLQAMTFAKGGEIFVLDMGKPVKIYDLAKNLIKLAGLEPDVDIKIEFCGLRPGEKLYEELLMSDETLEKTKHEKIYIEQPSNITQSQIKEKLDVLRKLLDKEKATLSDVKESIRKVVPTYKENFEVNKIKEGINDE